MRNILLLMLTLVVIFRALGVNEQKDESSEESMFPQVKQRIVQTIQETLPSNDASLVSGVVIGNKDDVDKKFYDQLKNTGTAHVLVASGMNVTLVAGFIMELFLKGVKRRTAIVLTIGSIWIYALLVGFQAPIIRAAIMGSFLFLSQLKGKLYDSLYIVCVTGLIMLAIKPQWIESISFWLSSGATISILLFNEPVKKWVTRVPGLLRDDLATSIAAQIATAPLIIVLFGQVNILSPLINALVLWVIGPMTLLGGIGALVALINPSIAKPIFLLTYPLTVWFRSV
jgi:competence protein ComEC